jgi:integration host factor beta subunit
MVAVTASMKTPNQDARSTSNKLNGKSAAGGNVMTKRDLIDEVNKRFPHLSRRDSEVIINAIFDAMVDSLAQGDRIEIRGFGSFVVKQRRARQGRNPKSGELVSVAAKRVPFFKVGKELRLRVDGKPYDPEDMDDDGADA